MIYHVLNLGAGVQSTCLYLLSQQPDFKYHFDVAIFADTQEEPQAVYDHLHWLCTLGKPEILIRTAGKLGDDLVNGTNSTGQRFASIPAFTKNADSLGKLRRQCTAEYKINVIEGAIRREVVGIKPRQWMPKGVKVYQYFGITVDERQRADRAKKRFENHRWAIPVYPFLEMGWTRQDCLAWLKDRVPHEVPRSACVFCPYHSSQEWLNLKTTDPVGWARAVEIDEALRTQGTRANQKLDGKMYLHRLCLPLIEIDFEKEARKRFCADKCTAECTGLCGV